MFSKKQAAQMLGVSLRTLDRHISAGKIAVERRSAAKFEQAVTITLASLEAYLGISDESELRQRLGLPPVVDKTACGPNSDPHGMSTAPEPCAADSAAHPEPAVPSTARPELPSLAQRTVDDLDLAERYLRGEVPDSAGNYVDGHNARWSETVTLLGPAVPPLPPPDVNSHMNPALLSDTGWDGISADSPEHPLNAGFKGIEVKRPSRHPNSTRMIGLSRALQVRHI